MKDITDKNFKSNNSEFMRNKEKQQQIDEIAECVLGGTIDYRLEVAELIYNKGYRKSSEGHWHYNPDGMDWGLGAWECSLCRCRNDNLPMDKNIKPLQWAGAKYCPNCGAKMKGECE